MSKFEEAAKRLEYSAEMYIRRDDIDSAFGLYKDLVKIFEKIGNKDKQASALNNLGNIYRLQKEYPEALENLEASARIYEELDNNQQRDFVVNLIKDVREKIK